MALPEGEVDAHHDHDRQSAAQGGLDGGVAQEDNGNTGPTFDNYLQILNSNGWLEKEQSAMGKAESTGGDLFASPMMISPPVRREFEGEKRYSPGREQQAVESVLSDDAAGDDELAGGIQSSTAQSAAERVAEVEDRQ